MDTSGSEPNQNKPQLPSQPSAVNQVGQPSSTQVSVGVRPQAQQQTTQSAAAQPIPQQPSQTQPPAQQQPSRPKTQVQTPQPAPLQTPSSPQAQPQASEPVPPQAKPQVVQPLSPQTPSGAQPQAATPEPQAQQPTVQPQAPQPQQVGRSAGAKEEEFVSSQGEVESVPIVELKEPGELPTEVEGWLERVERDDVAEPPTVVHQGRTVLQPAAPQQGSVTLPLDEDKMEAGLKQQIVNSIRWLAEWSKRIMKKFGGKVGYREK